MNIMDLRNIKSIGLHLLFWVGVWFFYMYFFSYNSENQTYIIWLANCLLPITMISSYVMIYKVLPDYLLQKRYFSFALYTFYIFVFTTYFITITILGNFIVLNKMSTEGIPQMSRNIVFVLILVNLIIVLVSSVSLISNNFQTMARNKELQNKILETQLKLKEQELEYLKKQIHPHFLFNTLNTIYGFALKQSVSTPEIILKLSNLLDYILYQVNKPSVSLQEEVLHIEEYIELEKIRFMETLDVEFSKVAIKKNVKVAPMLLIPFVENAFKHGRIINDKLKIKIKIRFTDDTLTFTISNTILDEENTSNGNSGGIGLENIRKRLELNYAGNYKLEMNKSNNWFQVDLVLNINSKKDETEN